LLRQLQKTKWMMLWLLKAIQMLLFMMTLLLQQLLHEMLMVVLLLLLEKLQKGVSTIPLVLALVSSSMI